MKALKAKIKISQNTVKIKILKLKKYSFLHTPVNLEEKHGWDVDGLEHDELDRVNGGHREGRRLLVGVVQLVEVLVQERPMEHTVTPIRKVILLEEKILFVIYLANDFNSKI